MTAEPLCDSTNELVGLTVAAMDITERYEAQNRTLHLQAVTAALSKALTADEVTHVITSQGAAMFGAVTGTVVLADETGTSLKIVGSTQYSDKELAALEPWLTFPVEAPVPLAEAAHEKKSIWLNSPDAWIARYPHLAQELEKVDHKAWAMVPLLFEEHLLGTMALAFVTPQLFSKEDQSFILSLAQQCAQAIQRAQLYEAERKSRAEAEAAVKLRNAFLSIAAHELKTPLTTMLGNIQLIQRRLAKGLLNVEQHQQQWRR